MEKIMYYPIQIPFMLNEAFSRNIMYTETPDLESGGFIVCFWEMQSESGGVLSVDNVIVTDACIDAVADFDKKQIGFSGMRKTNFHYEIVTPARFIGARLMPGAFYQLTGLPAGTAMDSFLPIEEIFGDFNREQFFSLPFERAKAYFKEYISVKARNNAPDMFTSLFNSLADNPPTTANDLYSMLHFSPRQCQRLFLTRYGLTPKTVLSIIRFQRCLQILTSPRSKPADILNVTGYYDQPHFIKDFKSNIGITPLELIRLYSR
jgi:AraC-like DNA-binding protein